MKTSLKIWIRPGTDQVRIYIGGTFRSDSKLFIATNDKGGIESHSINIDGTAKGIRGDLYGKRDKDRSAIDEVQAAVEQGKLGSKWEK